MAALLCAAALTAAACGGDDGEAFTLDSSPRVPDDEGVVTAVSVERVTIDGERTYDVSDELVSFTSASRNVRPLLNFEHHYVHIGLKDDKVVWLGGIGPVVQGSPPAVYYTGGFRRVEDGRAVFTDGTTLAIGKDVPQPPAGMVVQARIDPKAKAITGFLGAK